MRNLFAFLIRHHVFFVFILLEIIAMGMILQSHYYQASRFASSSSVWSGQLLENYRSSTDYLSLKKINDLLAEENAMLKNSTLNSPVKLDNLEKGQYQYISAKVVKNSYNKRNNYITINKGALHGIENGMGVCIDEGVVGIVRDVSDHYATVMSVLNQKTVISTRFAKSNHFGELHWDGKSHEFAQLHSIEKYVNVSVGDSLVTNSYSSIFPENINIGTVNRFQREEASNFYNIEVDLSVDFNDLNYVYIIKDLLKKERLQLEKKQGE